MFKSFEQDPARGCRPAQYRPDRIFLAVVDEGSFNGAARRMGRAISVISYGIANLEGQLGVSLFDREGSRKPQLTDAGRAVLASARAVADDVDAMMARVRGHNQGLEAELTVAVDVMFPTRLLARLLQDFLIAFPTVDLRLHVEALGAVTALLLEKRADLGIAGAVMVDDPALERMAIGQVDLVPVAAPGHALAQMAARTGALAPGWGATISSSCCPTAPRLRQGAISRSWPRGHGGWAIWGPSTRCCFRGSAGATCPVMSWPGIWRRGGSCTCRCPRAGRFPIRSMPSGGAIARRARRGPGCSNSSWPATAPNGRRGRGMLAGDIRTCKKVSSFWHDPDILHH
jgi:DNA-binding transcriptional LysR family regulator